MDHFGSVWNGHRSKVERFALENHLGQQSFADLQQAIQNNQELIQAGPNKYTTQTAIQQELDTIRLMQTGKGQVAAIASPDEIERHLAQESTLTHGQRGAIELSGGSCDRILAWQGVAGSGKTYSLKLLKDLAETKGYTIQGFAPSAEAAHTLAKAAQIPSDTVASLLSRQVETSPTDKTIWIVDEAGLLSAKDAHALLQRATTQQARVILVGDTRQLSAVEAGNPFKSLQAGGIQTAYLEESRRQKTQNLKAAVAMLEAGQLEQAIHHLDQTGAIQVIPQQDQRFQKITQDYLNLSPKEQRNTLLLAGNHTERLALTTQIRQALQQQNILGEDTFTLTSLRSRNLTTAQATYASHYQPGDVIVPSHTYKSQGLVKYQQYRVIQTNRETNRITVETPQGQLLIINPTRCQRKTVYAIQQIPIARGDQLRWTRNNRDAKIRNGQRFTITAIDQAGNAQIVDNNGNHTQVNLQGHQYIDYALVSTTYSSQGKTADRVLALMDSSISQESFYVAASRAKHQLCIYTANTAELAQRVLRSQANENASDYIPLFQVTHAQTQKSSYQTNAPASDRRNVGESLGDRLAKNLAATLWRDRHPATREQQTTAAVDQLHHSTNGYSNLIRQLEQAGLELDRSAAAVTANPEPVDGILPDQQSGKATAILGAVGPEFKQLEHQLDRQQQLTTAANELLSRLESAGTLKKLRKKRHYQKLWAHYSQGIQTQNPRELDYRVAHRAFASGLDPKKIGLMLTAGSSHVRQLYEQTGQQQAVTYVNQTVRQLAQREEHGQRLRNQIQIEL